MDIHRCRFVPFPPSSINALAFSCSHVNNDQKISPLRLAVGRANGDIEIWNPTKGSWLQETIIRGGKDRSIDGLVWTQDDNEEVEGKTIIGRARLFSIGYTTTVTEWNLATGSPLRQASGNHGEIWCLAAQPAAATPSNATNQNLEGQGKNLIAGCTDGALVLYSTHDDDLKLQKILVRPSSKKAKIISVSFQTRNFVVAGCTDSTIRIFDIRNGNLLRAMTLGSGPRGGPKDIIVWSVKSLNDGTIISGDSTGELKIWDANTYTLRQRILAHKKDVLCLAVSADSTSIFTGGMDRRTVMYKLVAKGKNRWVEIAHRRFHIHDVKSIAIFEGLGHDASPIVVPMGKYGFENHRTLPFLSQNPPLASAPKARLMMSWWDREIRVWKIDKQNNTVDEEFHEDSVRKPILLAKIYLKGEASITSAAINSEGNVLTVATTTEFKAFRLKSHTNINGENLQISKLELPLMLSGGARLIAFSPDGKWLCVVRPDCDVVLARLIYSTSSIEFASDITQVTRLNRHIDKLVQLGGLGNCCRTITQVTFSADSRILAVSDLAGYIDSFLLSGNEYLSTNTKLVEDFTTVVDESDSEADDEDEGTLKSRPIMGQCWKRNPAAGSIPQLPATPVVLSFRPSATCVTRCNSSARAALNETSHPITNDLIPVEDRLLVVTATSLVFEFRMLEGRLSEWSRRNPPASFPEKYKKTLETVRGVIWDVRAKRERVWLYSVGWLWMFNLARDLEVDGTSEVSLKRKRNNCGAGGGMEKTKSDIGIGRTLSKVIPGEIYEDLDIFAHDDMDVDEDGDEEISRLPRPSKLIKQNKHADKEKEKVDGRLITTNKITTASQNAPKTIKTSYTYHTFKYRPIVGVVVMGETDAVTGPEVALVERPIWETELPSQYYGEQEWRSQEIDV